MLLKSFLSIKTSPLNVNLLGTFLSAILKGSDLIVLTFCVTSSPRNPSPLVIAFENSPSIYVRLIASPSNLGSANNIVLSLFNVILIFL